MNNISKNGVAIVTLILSILGVEATESEILAIVGVVGQIVAILVMVWHQHVERAETKGFIFKE